MGYPSRSTSRALVGGLLAGFVLLSTPAASAAPSPDEIQRQRAAAAQLQAQVQQQAARLRVEQAVVGQLAVRVNLALDSYQHAREQLLAAETSLRQQENLLATARRVAAGAEQRLTEYAVRSYQSRSSGESLAATGMLLDQTGPTDLAQRMGYLRAVGNWNVGIVQQSRNAAEAERRATLDAQAAAATRRAAAAAAAAAKQRAESLVAQQQALVASLAAGLAKTEGAAQDAQRKAAALERARAIALELQRRALAAQRAGERAAPFDVVVMTGDCAGGALGGFPNGQLPTGGLCPLWGAPGHLLRSDAAATFSRMSQAFAEQFSRPICVTDSYRSYPDQVRLYAEKPGLAAFPGTSQHGWGRAVDLCGGIQSFGTPEHQWLAINAPQFRWFHPSWAAAGGSRPEPWHFEYGG